MVTVCCCYIYIFFFWGWGYFHLFFFFKIIVAFIVASFVGRCPPKKVGDAKIRDIFIRGIFIFWQIRNFFFFFLVDGHGHNGYFVIFRSWCMEKKKWWSMWAAGKGAKKGGELQQNDNVNIIHGWWKKFVCIYVCMCADAW